MKIENRFDHEYEFGCDVCLLVADSLPGYEQGMPFVEIGIISTSKFQCTTQITHPGAKGFAEEGSP